MQVHPDFEVVTIKRKSDGKMFTVGELVVCKLGYMGSGQARIKTFRYNPSGDTVKLVVDVLTIEGKFIQSIPIDDLKG